MQSFIFMWGIHYRNFYFFKHYLWLYSTASTILFYKLYRYKGCYKNNKTLIYWKLQRAFSGGNRLNQYFVNSFGLNVTDVILYEKVKCWTGLTHVGEADGRWARHTRTFGQLIFLESVGQAVQVVFTLSSQTQPQINLDLGLDCPASRPKTFLTRDL